MINKKIFVSFFVAFFIFGLFLGYKNLFRNTLSDKSTIKIGTGFELNSAPLILAAENNFFDKYDIKVEILPFNSGEEIATALSLGKIDIGFSSINSLAISLANGGPIKLIGFSHRTPSFLFVRPDGTADFFKDLIGKNIVSREGSSADLLFRKILKERGIESDEIIFLDMESSARPIALMEKKIVNAVTASGSEEAVFRKAGAVIMKEWQDSGYDQIGLPRVFAVNTDFLNSHPDLVEAFVKGYIDGHRFVASEKEAAADLFFETLIKENNGVDNLTSEEILKNWSTKQIIYVLWDDIETVVDLIEVGNDLGKISKALTANEIFDFRFRDMLEAAQKEIYETKN